MVDCQLMFLFAFCMGILSSLVTSLPRSCTMDMLFVNCKKAGLDAVPSLPPNATSVDLSFNQITQLHQTQFSNLPDLNILLLSFNKITSIENGTFQSLGKLVSLELSNNSLTVVSSATFQGLSESLQMLSLMNNLNLTVQEGTLQTLYNISQLLLKNFVGAGTYNFSHMTSLNFLTAPDCKIESLNPTNFLGLSSLSSLDLAGNCLKRFPSTVIDQLSALERFNMEYNNIDRTEGPLVSHNSSITTLNLDFNNLGFLHPKTFQGMTKLSTLTLTNNKIMGLPENVFNQLNSSSIDVKLLGNPIMCDCTFRWMTDWLQVPNHHMDEVTCAFPVYLFEESVKNLTPDKFVCLPESLSGSIQYNVTVGDNLTISNPFPHYEYTNYTWYTTCHSKQLEIKAGDTYSFGTDSSLVITNVKSSICLYYEIVAANIAGTVDVTVILQLSGVSKGSSVLVIVLSVAVGVVGLIAIVALACHFSRIRKFSRSINMLRYNNLSEDTDA